MECGEDIVLPLTPGHTLKIMRFSGVRNGDEIMKCVMNGSLDVALINPDMVFNKTVLQVAATVSALHFNQNCMVTKNINSELIYNLSGQKKVTLAFKTIGFSKQMDRLLLCRWSNSTSSMESIRSTISGTLEPCCLEEHIDEAMLQDYYNINSNELEVGSLEEAIIYRVGTVGVL